MVTGGGYLLAVTEPKVRCARYDQASDPKEPNLLDIEMQDHENHAVCRPVGELDAYTVPQFRDVLASVTPGTRLLIDLSDVPFMDSAGLGALIGGIRRIREANGDVAVACGRPTLMRLLHTTGFDRIVPVSDSVDEAVSALTEPDSGSPG